MGLQYQRWVQHKRQLRQSSGRRDQKLYPDNRSTKKCGQGHADFCRQWGGLRIQYGHRKTAAVSEAQGCNRWRHLFLQQLRRTKMVYVRFSRSRCRCLRCCDSEKGRQGCDFGISRRSVSFVRAHGWRFKAAGKTRPAWYARPVWCRCRCKAVTVRIWI